MIFETAKKLRLSELVCVYHDDHEDLRSKLISSQNSSPKFHWQF